MRKTLLTLPFLLLSFCSHANFFISHTKDSAYNNANNTNMPHKTPQTIYVESGNTGMLGSISYDRHLSKKPGGFGFKIGYATDFSRISGVPVGVYYLLGQRKNFLELGLGETYLAAKKEAEIAGLDYPEDYEMQTVLFFSMNDLPPGKTEFLHCFTIGYRLQPPTWGFCFRTGFTGFALNKNAGSGNFYISLGVAF